MPRTALATSLVLAACASEPCLLDYGTCASDPDCASGTCEQLDWEYGEGSMCARECESELDCPALNGHFGRCIDVNRSGRFRCYPDCGGDLICPSGWACQPIRSGGELGRICLP